MSDDSVKMKLDDSDEEGRWCDGRERQEEKRAKVVGACVIVYGKVPTVGHLGEVELVTLSSSRLLEDFKLESWVEGLTCRFSVHTTGYLRKKKEKGED